MNIIIKSKDRAFSAYAENDFVPLFHFEYRSEVPAWYFWLRGEANPTIIKGQRKDFPIEFFENACRAKYFIRFEKGINDEVNIIKAPNYIH